LLGCREGKSPGLIAGHRPNCSQQSVTVVRGQQLDYRRFAPAAEAIGPAAQEFPAIRALGAWMQVGDGRFTSEEIGNP